MSVYKRKTSAGQTEFYHYKFMKNSKTYTGVCEGCTTKKEAEAFEADLKKAADRDARKNEKRDVIIQTYSDIFLGEGQKILIADAFEEAQKKNYRACDIRHTIRKRNVWRAFAEFMSEKYKSVQYIHDVTKSHAVAYIDYLRATKKPTNTALITYIIYLKEVFYLLTESAGLIINPFDQVARPQRDKKEEREVYTESDIRKIQEGIANGVQCADVVGGLFIVGLHTGLRLGDIATLKWQEITLTGQTGWIKRVMRKTGNTVTIPMMAELRLYLEDLQSKAEPTEEYVFPRAKKLYLSTSQTLLSRKVKKFLSACGIEGLTEPPKNGRKKAITKKDFHSCRHTFCYLAGKAGIPMGLVQSIVGHLTPQMTQLYSAHATAEDKAMYIERMAGFIPVLPSTDADIIDIEAEEVKSDRVTAQNILNRMSDEEIAEFIRKYQKKLQ